MIEYRLKDEFPSGDKITKISNDTRRQLNRNYIDKAYLAVEDRYQKAEAEYAECTQRFLDEKLIEVRNEVPSDCVRIFNNSIKSIHKSLSKLFTDKIL